MRVLGPDWFSRLEFQRVHSSLFKFLLKKNPRRQIDQSITYFDYNYDQLVKGNLAHNSLSSTYFLPLNRVIQSNQEYQGETRVCIAKGAGSLDRDLTSLFLQEILEVMDEFQLESFVLDGNSNSTSISEKLDSIRTSSLLVCNDSGWYHVADAFKVPILCISPKPADSDDRYIKSAYAREVIRSPERFSNPVSPRALQDSKSRIKDEMRLCIEKLLLS